MAFNIICFGDSITEGSEFPEPYRWTSLLQEQLDTAKPGAFKVYNRGIGNSTTAQGLDRFGQDVLPLLPGLVLVQFGFNDANIYDWAKVPRVSLFEFKKNMTEYHRIANRWGGTCVFIVNHTIGQVTGRQGNRKTYNENFGPYNQSIRSLAIGLKTPYIDLPEMMAKRDINLDDFLSLDSLHLSLEANDDYAAMIFEAINSEAFQGYGL